MNSKFYEWILMLGGVKDFVLYLVKALDSDSIQ